MSKEEMSLVEYVSDTGGDIKLTPEIVKQYLVSGDAEKVTDQEMGMFLALCKFQKLNPFLKEAYLIKYGTAPATIVTGKEAFLKRATRNPIYKGHRTGIEDDGQVAWAEVYKEGFEVPIRVEVDFDEYVGKKRDGTVNAQWATKPKTMLKKVALVQALREAFPEDLGSLYTEEETDSFVDVTPENTPSKSSTVKPAKKESAKKKTVAKEEEGDVRSSLTELLHKVCSGDEGKMLEVLKQVSVFEGDNGDIWMKSMKIIDSTKIGWVGKAYSALKDMIVKDGLVPEDCTHNPDTCSHSSFADDVPFCGDKDCLFQEKDKVW